jgi:hypothetical protein
MLCGAVDNVIAFVLVFRGIGFGLQAAQKCSNARRAKDRRAEAYSCSTLERDDLSATKHMGVFQQPARS